MGERKKLFCVNVDRLCNFFTMLNNRNRFTSFNAFMNTKKYFNESVFPQLKNR